jgi:hypothetical protein
MQYGAGTGGARTLERFAFTSTRHSSGLGERAVHRQPQILTIHAAILAKADE